MEEQNGFHAGRPCTDNIFVLQQLIEKRKGNDLSTQLLHLDLKKASETVPLEKTVSNIDKSWCQSKAFKEGVLFKVYIQLALEQWINQVSGVGIDMGSFKCLTTLFFAADQVVVANT